MTTFNVTATADKTTYNAGDKVTITITGDATTSAVTSILNAALTLTAADGATGTVNVMVPVTKPGQTETVTITKVTDDGGRVWTIATGAQSATATA